MDTWVTICLLLEFIVFLISALHFKKLKERGLGSFPFFLFLNFAGELLGVFLALKFHNNIVFYNIFSILQIIYYLVLIRGNIMGKKARKAVLITIIVFVAFSLVNYFFIQKLNKELESYTFTLGCLLISVWVVYFFSEMILSKEVENCQEHPFFWIALGLFIFYVCNIPYMSVYNYLANNYAAVFNAYFSIIEILSYTMYSFFIIGILCTNRKKSRLR